MDLNKILFVDHEIYPYLPDTPTSRQANQLAQGVQERGIEVRTFMPKYGCINERRNQLHEVIRLSGMNIIIDDNDHPLIIKVATLQPTRMQVYFFYNDDYFQHGGTKELETVTSPADNDERSIFFVRGSLETVKKLRWIPEVVQCQGWISALTAVYLRYVYNDDPVFANAKVVLQIFNDKLTEPLDARLADKLRQDGVPAEALKAIDGKPVGTSELWKLAIDAADAVVQASPDSDPELIDYAKKANKPVLPYPGDGDESIDAYIDFYRSL